MKLFRFGRRLGYETDAESKARTAQRTGLAFAPNFGRVHFRPFAGRENHVHFGDRLGSFGTFTGTFVCGLVLRVWMKAARLTLTSNIPWFVDRKVVFSTHEAPRRL